MNNQIVISFLCLFIGTLGKPSTDNLAGNNSPPSTIHTPTPSGSIGSDNTSSLDGVSSSVYALTGSTQNIASGLKLNTDPSVPSSNTSGIPSGSIDANTSVITPPPTPPSTDTTTSSPNTTTTITTTITPTTPTTATPAPTTITTITPITIPTPIDTSTTQTTTATPSTITTVTSTQATTTPTPTPTPAPSKDRRFDGPSFIGGIVLSLGIIAIGFVAWKFYKARTERNYHTL